MIDRQRAALVGRLPAHPHEGEAAGGLVRVRRAAFAGVGRLLRIGQQLAKERHAVAGRIGAFLRPGSAAAEHEVGEAPTPGRIFLCILERSAGPRSRSSDSASGINDRCHVIIGAGLRGRGRGRRLQRAGLVRGDPDIRQAFRRLDRRIEVVCRIDRDRANPGQRRRRLRARGCVFVRQPREGAVVVVELGLPVDIRKAGEVDGISGIACGLAELRLLHRRVLEIAPRREGSVDDVVSNIDIVEE